MTPVACVIPTHGRPEFLAESLRSVLAQSGVRIAEIVVVDDLGTEATWALVDEVARSHPEAHIRYFHREEGAPGASASRNFGLRASKADVIAFLDDDDLWSPDHLERALSALQHANAVLSLSWMNVLDDEGAKPHFSVADNLEFHDVLAQNPGITGSNVVITRAAFELAGGFDEELPVSNDKDFFASFLRAGLNYTVVRTRTVTHRRHSSGQLTAWNESRAEGLEKYLSKYRAHVSPSDRRFLQRQIHSIRFRTSHGLTRYREFSLMVLRSSPKTLANRISARVWNHFLSGKGKKAAN